MKGANEPYLLKSVSNTFGMLPTFPLLAEFLTDLFDLVFFVNFQLILTKVDGKKKCYDEKISSEINFLNYF